MRRPVLDRELDQPLPRPLRLSGDGRRELAWTAAVLAEGAFVAWIFLATPARPTWLDGLFVAFALVGALWVYRTAVVWISRLGLVRRGAAEWGVVVARRPEADGRMRYVVWYSAGGKEWSVEASGDAAAAEVGDALTVLRLAEAPGQSLIYRFARVRAAAPKTLDETSAEDDTVAPRRIR